MSIAIAGARISHVSQNLTKLCASKLQVKMENFETWSLNARNFVKFLLTWAILAPAIAIVIMIMNQFGFFCFRWVCELKSLPRGRYFCSKSRFLTPGNIEKTQLEVYLKNCSVYVICSLINEKKVWHCYSLYSLRKKTLNVAEFCGAITSMTP